MRIKQLTPIAYAIAAALPSVAKGQEVTVQAVTAYQTEIKNSYQTKQVNAHSAWRLGATGKGVVVSVIDTGVTASNPELKNALLRGYNTVNMVATTNSTDPYGHGTHVAGIIAAAANNSGVVGVAPETKILPIRVMAPNLTISTLAVDRAFRIAADNSPIASVSLGGPPSITTGLKYAIGKGMLVVAAAGNDGANSPTWPAAYAKETWAMGRIIAVGAVDGANKIASWSNRAGDTKNFFVVAPGVNVISTYQNGYAMMSGTSMATPVVSGVAALIKSYWPKLKAEEVAQIIFKTATDLGSPGVDPVYGWGLVNAEKAMKPIGTTTLATASGAKVPLKSLVMVAPAASGKALSANAIIAIGDDAYGRGFAFDLSSAMLVDQRRYLASALLDVGRQVDSINLSAENGNASIRITRLTSGGAFGEQAGLSQEVPGGIRLDEFSWIGRSKSGAEYAIGAGGTAHRFFGLALAGTQSDAMPAASENPMFSLVPGHSHFGYGVSLGGAAKLRAGVVTAAGASALLGQTGIAAATPRATMPVVALSGGSERSAYGITAGALMESGSLLGGKGGDGIAFDGVRRTSFATVEGGWKLGQTTTAFAKYTIGLTAAASGGAGANLMQGNGALIEDAFSAGAITKNLFGNKDYVSITLSQPMRIRTGELSLALPQGEDESGRQIIKNEALSLVPDGRELRTQFEYGAQTSKVSAVSGFLTHRYQPGHDSRATNDVAVGLIWKMLF